MSIQVLQPILLSLISVVMFFFYLGEVMFSIACLSLFQQDYIQPTGPIYMKVCGKSTLLVSTGLSKSRVPAPSSKVAPCTAKVCFVIL